MSFATHFKVVGHYALEEVTWLTGWGSKWMDLDVSMYRQTTDKME